MPSVTVRGLPEPVYDWLSNSAKRNRQSMSALAAIIIENSYKRQTAPDSTTVQQGASHQPVPKPGKL